MNKKYYECIKDFEVEIYDDEGFSTDEYFTVKKGSIWETNLKPYYGYSDIYLTACDDNADYNWLEISHARLNEYFKECENNDK